MSGILTRNNKRYRMMKTNARKTLAVATRRFSNEAIGSFRERPGGSALEILLEVGCFRNPVLLSSL